MCRPRLHACCGFIIVLLVRDKEKEELSEQQNMATNHTTQNKIVKESDAEYNYDTYQHHEIRRIARWMAKHIACTTQSVIS
jgi:hypothetical protein